MHLAEAVFRCDDEGLGQVIAGHNTAVFLCPGQKFPCALGGGCVVHMKNAHNRVRPHGHIVADVQIHKISLSTFSTQLRPARRSGCSWGCANMCYNLTSNLLPAAW